MADIKKIQIDDVVYTLRPGAIFKGSLQVAATATSAFAAAAQALHDDTEAVEHYYYASGSSTGASLPTTIATSALRAIPTAYADSAYTAADGYVVLGADASKVRMGGVVAFRKMKLTNASGGGALATETEVIKVVVTPPPTTVDLSGYQPRMLKTVLDSSVTEIPLPVDTMMYFPPDDPLTTLTVAELEADPEDGYTHEYQLQFTASADGCTLTLPGDIIWQGGSAPTIEAGKTYQLSIVNNLAVMAAFG